MREQIDHALEAMSEKEKTFLRKRMSPEVLRIARSTGKKVSRRVEAKHVRQTARQQKAMELRLQGKFDWEIAEVLGVDRRTVQQDVRAVRDAWAASAIVDMDLLKAEEIAKINYLERQQWITIEETSEISKERGEWTDLDQKRISDAQRVIMWCIDRRIKTRGLDAPIEINWRVEAARHGVDVDKMYHQMVDSFATAIIDETAVAQIEAGAENIPKELQDDDDDDPDGDD